MTAAAVLVCLATAALLVGLAPRLSSFTGPDFREGLVATERPLSLNPLIGADTPAVHDVGHLLYRSLVRLDVSAYPQPDLARTYTVDQSGLVYTLTLRPGQRWSDGSAITSADVVATLAFAQSKEAGDRTLSGLLNGVQAKTDAGTIVFTLPAPRAAFVATLTQLPILPLGRLTRSQTAALPTQTNSPMATSGLYRVLSSDATALELASNSYAASRVTLGHVELRLYATFNDAAAGFARGDVDAVLATTPAQRARLLGQPHAIAHDIATFRFVDLLFNERVPGLDDPVVRRAVAAAVSRASIIKGALAASGGLLETDAITRGLPWAGTKDPQEQPSLSAARAALDAGGWRAAAGGVRERAGVTLRFSLLVADSDPLPQVARELARQLSGLGISVSVDVVPAQTFVAQSLQPRVMQIALADWNTGPDPDVSAFWRSNAAPPKGFFVSGGDADPFLDQALDMLATLTSRNGRVAAAESVLQHLADDVPAVFLYTPTVSYVVRGPLAAVSVPLLGAGEARYDAVATWRRA